MRAANSPETGAYVRSRSGELRMHVALCRCGRRPQGLGVRDTHRAVHTVLHRLGGTSPSGQCRLARTNSETCHFERDAWFIKERTHAGQKGSLSRRTPV